MRNVDFNEFNIEFNIFSHTPVCALYHYDHVVVTWIKILKVLLQLSKLSCTTYFSFFTVQYVTYYLKLQVKVENHTE